MPIDYAALNANLSPEALQQLRSLARHLRNNPTPAEHHLWLYLRKRIPQGLQFRRQHRLGPYIADFYCPTAALIIELDGPVHDLQRERDAQRDAFLTAAGLTVLRFSNHDALHHTDAVLARILRALKPPPR